MKFNTLALLGLTLGLFACDGGEATETDTDIIDTDTDVIDTDTDIVIPTPDPFLWTVVEADGDGVADTAGVADADTFTVTITNGAANFPDIASWEFGIAQTGAGAGGWYGEDCDGAEFGAGQGDRCHPISDDSTVVLTRVGMISAIVPGSTTLNLRDLNPPSDPQNTYVLFGLAADGSVDTCWVGGEDVSFYSALNCETVAL